MGALAILILHNWEWIERISIVTSIDDTDITLEEVTRDIMFTRGK